MMIVGQISVDLLLVVLLEDMRFTVDDDNRETVETSVSIWGGITIK